MTEEPYIEPRGLFFRRAAIFYFLLAMAAVIWIGADRGIVSVEVFFTPPKLLGDVTLGIGAGALLLAVTWLGRRFVPSFAKLETRLSQMLASVTRGEALALALISGFAEELFFRGAVQSSWGFLWATILFALLHTGPDRLIGIWTVFALAAGALFAGMTVLRGTILSAVIAHAMVNGVNLHRLVGGIEPGAPDAPDLVD